MLQCQLLLTSRPILFYNGGSSLLVNTYAYSHEVIEGEDLDSDQN